MKVALVTGTRRTTRAGVISRALKEFNPDIVIHGACPTGVDAEADGWARANRRQLITVPALWDELGSAAGRARNEVLATVAQAFGYLGEVRAIAVPDDQSIGTHDTTRKCRRKLVRVYEL